MYILCATFHVDRTRESGAHASPNCPVHGAGKAVRPHAAVARRRLFDAQESDGNAPNVRWLWCHAGCTCFLEIALSEALSTGGDIEM